MDTWLSVTEVRNLEMVSERAIRKRIAEGKYAQIRQVESSVGGGSGGKVWEVHLESLSPAARDRYWEKEADCYADPAEAIEAWVAENRLRLTPADLAKPLVQNQLAVYRSLQAVPKYQGRTELAQELAKRYNVHEQTVWRWFRTVKNWKVTERTPYIKVEGTTVKLPRKRKFDPEAIRFGLSVFLSNRHNGMKAAYKRLAQNAEKHGWSIGDYSNFTRLVRSLPPQIHCLSEKGEVGFEMEYAPKIRREWLTLPVFTVLCGDQKVCDYQVFDPATDEVYAMNYYLWMDCSTRYWAGLWPAFGPYNKYTYGASLREACRIAMPGSIYTDWGKPEISHYARDLENRLSSCSVRLGDWGDYANAYGGLDRKMAQAGKPWHKPIENHMNIFERRLKDRFTEGYRHRAGNEWVNKQRQTELKRARDKGLLLSVEEFMELCMSIMREHNNGIVKVQEKDGGIVPSEVLKEGLGESGRLPYHDDTLDMLFLPSFQRKIRQSSVTVKLGEGDRRSFYIPAADASNIGADPVQVLPDPFDPEKPAIILTMAGEFVCHAEKDNMVTPGDTSAVQIRLTRQREYMNFWKKSFREIVDKDIGRSVRTVTQIGPASRAAKQAAKQADVIPLRGDRKGADAFLEDYYDKHLAIK